MVGDMRLAFSITSDRVQIGMFEGRALRRALFL